MRILWVKAGGLVPPDLGGRIRSYQILRELAKHHSVTLFTFYGIQPDDPHPALQQIFEKVIHLPLKIPASGSRAEYLNFARHLFSPWPYSVAKYCWPQVRKKLGKLLQDESYDCIICDFVVAGGVIPWESRCPKILFTHNVEAMIWERHLQVARNPLWKAVYRREYRRMLRFERSCMERSDHVFTVSQVDRDYFAQMIAAEKLSVIPTGVDTDYFQPAAGAEEPDTLVFTGAMDWEPNEDAMLYFADEILPRIQREMPSAKLCVVGRRPSARLQATLARQVGVTVTGRVEDVRPYVHGAAVYVVPLRVGSGTRLKIFEAMAMGKAVVSTTVGAEGLPVTPGVHLLLADTSEDFAEKALMLLRQPALRQQLGAAARRLVEGSYSWGSVASEFAAVMERVVAQHRRQAQAASGRLRSQKEEQLSR